VSCGIGGSGSSTAVRVICPLKVEVFLLCMSRTHVLGGEGGRGRGQYSSLFLRPNIYFYYINYLFCGTGAWTQDLHLEPLHQSFFCDGFFQDRVSWTICLGWFPTMISLISASWEARITGMSHWCQHTCIGAWLIFIFFYLIFIFLSTLWTPSF
jgi:hypothetical protein